MGHVPPILAVKLKIKIKNLVELNTNIYILFYYITLTFHSKVIGFDKDPKFFIYFQF